jgi:hypothetical protein
VSTPYQHPVAMYVYGVHLFVSLLYINFTTLFCRGASQFPAAATARS